jgi:hypothetical protein
MFPRFPFPSPPGLPKLFREETIHDPESVKPQTPQIDPLEQAFREQLLADGYPEALIEMGVKVARNHLKTPQEAYQIGYNYVKQMAK